ncbi:MAG: hypothetical protein KDE27_19615, partial [Planctomycetes bacterium]|nr:hypothetical protein [Planctomycetota bacterium]
MRLRTNLLALAAALLPSGLALAQAIPLPQNVDDSTFGPLLSGNTYVANQAVVVGSGRTLTVQAGAVVKFASGTGMQVAGTLDVNGTASQPAWFTSTRDGAVGVPIDPLPPAPGDWRWLQFVSTNTSQLFGLNVRYGGGNLVPGAVQTLQANILLDGVTITDSAADGLDVDGSSPLIRNCRFDNNTIRGIADAPFQALPGFTNNTASGNGFGDAIFCTSGTVSGVAQIGLQNLTGGPVVHVNTNVQVRGTGQLTLDAGVILKFEDSTRLTVDGALFCNGTASDPVVCTSIDDDTVGGDTAKDGPTLGSPGDWDGVRFSTAGSQLLQTVVRFGGDGLGGGIELQQAGILLDGVAVERSLTDGLDVGGSSPTVRNCRFDDNLGRSIDRVPFGGLELYSNNTATGNALGNAIRVTSGQINGSTRSVAAANLIDATIVLAAIVNVSSTGSLTIGPGVICKAEIGNIGFTGRLVCNGTASAPVVFTSIADDSIGGDTANDGPTVGTPGDWRGLSPGTILELRFARVRFAGRSQIGGVQLQNLSNIVIEDTAIEFSSTDGLAITGTRPTVHRCRFDGNAGRAVDGFSWPQLAGFRDNTASGNTLGDYTRLRSGTTGGSGTVTRVDVWNTLNSDGVIAVEARTSLQSNTTLALGAGLILKFTNPTFNTTGFAVGGAGTHLVFDGRGYAPIVLTAITDDEWGGDTNGDGNATAPAPGAWGRVDYVNGAGTAQMNHVLARFGGLGGTAAVFVDSPNVSLDAVRVELSISDGMRIAQNGGGCRNLVAFGNSGDGIVMSATNTSLIHATVAANLGRGVVTQGTHTGAASACISWFNGVGANDNYVGFVDNLGQPVRMFSSLGSPLHHNTQNNFVADPLFVDPNNGDLSVSLFSPCIGRAGAPNDAFTYEDHDGRSRVLDHNLFGFALPDIGAYEYGVYDATISGVPRLGSTVSFVVEGKPFQGNPPGAGILFFGGPFLGVGVFLP